MARMKDLVIEVLELYENRTPLVVIASYMDMSIEEVLQIVEMYGE